MSAEADPMTPAEMALLDACRTVEAWNALCDDVKSRRGGRYPSDWNTGWIGRVLARQDADKIAYVSELVRNAEPKAGR